jgi:hypothetical protein
VETRSFEVEIESDDTFAKGRQEARRVRKQ